MSETDETRIPEWHLGKARTEQIGEVLGQTNQELRTVYRDRSLDDVEEWFASLRALWRSFKYFVPEEDRRETEQMIDRFYEKLNRDKAAMEKISRREIGELHDQVQRLLVEESGLGIPTKAADEDEYGPEDLYL
ncbi:MAG: hypothetical protein ABEJ07_05330 [Candidatus Nanohaloarchaea archaeon]